jgi:hypothetical protein
VFRGSHRRSPRSTPAVKTSAVSVRHALRDLDRRRRTGTNPAETSA